MRRTTVVEANYWQAKRSRITRRRALGVTAGGGLALAASGLLGCSGSNKSAGPSAAPAQQAATMPAQGTPQPGGTLNVYVPANTPLDPQRVSAQPQRVVAG